MYCGTDATKMAVYTLKNMNKPMCRTMISNCRYYRDDMEACFECENGFAVTFDGKCSVCSNEKLKINVRGERVCVDTAVVDCE